MLCSSVLKQVQHGEGGTKSPKNQGEERQRETKRGTHVRRDRENSMPNKVMLHLF